MQKFLLYFFVIIFLSSCSETKENNFKMQKFLLYFFVIIFLSSCSETKENNLEIYKSFKSNFNDEPFIILKNNLKNEDLNYNKYFEVSFPRYVYVFNHSYIYVVKKYDEREFKLKVRRLKSKSKINKKISNSNNYFTINKNDSIAENFFPLPDISNEYSSLKNYVDKNEDYILGINYKKGIFFNEHFYNENRKNEKLIKYLETSKNGYSNGAIISPKKKTITYWVLIW